MDTATEERGGEPRWQAASLREIVMGAQDNLTNVLAVVLGVAIGSGKTETVALAGLAAGLAEAVSMGGVLYTSTKAERDLQGERDHVQRRPVRSALITFASALVAASIPLAPFAVLPLRPAMAASVVASVSALFVLGGWKGTVTGRRWWRDGFQFVAIGGLAALAAALVGAALKTNGI